MYMVSAQARALPRCLGVCNENAIIHKDDIPQISNVATTSRWCMRGHRPIVTEILPLCVEGRYIGRQMLVQACFSGSFVQACSAPFPISDSPPHIVLAAFRGLEFVCFVRMPWVSDEGMAGGWCFHQPPRTRPRLPSSLEWVSFPCVSCCTRGSGELRWPIISGFKHSTIWNQMYKRVSSLWQL